MGATGVVWRGPCGAGLLERVEIDLSSDRNNLDNIRKCITAGFFYHTSKLQKNGSYRTAGAYTRPLFSST